MAASIPRPRVGASPTAGPLPGLLPERLRPPRRVVDGAIAVGMAVFLVAAVTGLDSGYIPSGAELPLAVAAGLVLAPRRRFPVAITAAETLIILAVLELGGSAFTLLALMVAVYTLASVRERRVAIPVACAAAATVAYAVNIAAGASDRFIVVAALLAVGGSMITGLYVGTRRAYVEQLGEHAARLEREQELLAERVVTNERERIARELHDVVAHHVSLMVVQAGAAREVLGADHPVSGTLEAQGEVGRQALAEMRRMLGLLRGDTEHAPQPGLAELPALAQQVLGSGLRVEVVREGDGPAPPDGVGLSAYRIVQEALTNAIRHGRATAATVTVRHLPGRLEVEVTDDGTATGTGEPGHGLVGMRERAALFGGTLTAGARPEGGWRVHAVLPLDGGT